MMEGITGNVSISTSDQQNFSTIVLPWYSLTLTGVSSGLSILGCIMIFWTFYLFSEIRNSTRWLLLYLTVADLLTAVGYFAGNIRYGSMHFTETSNREAQAHLFCKLQAGFTTFSNMASYFWTVFLAIHLLVSCSRQNYDLCNFRYSRKIFHGISWGVPGAITIAAFAKNVFGEDDHNFGSGSWCFIRGDMSITMMTVWTVVCCVGWEVVCYYTTCGVCFLLIRRLYRLQRLHSLQTVAPHLRKEDRNFLFAGLVLYILKVWGTARFLWLAINPNAYEADTHWQRDALDVLQNLQCLLSAAQGLVNCVFFCLLDQTVRRKMREKWCPKSFPEARETLHLLNPD